MAIPITLALPLLAGMFAISLAAPVSRAAGETRKPEFDPLGDRDRRRASARHTERY